MAKSDNKQNPQTNPDSQKPNNDDVKKKYRVVLTSLSTHNKSYAEGEIIELTDSERVGIERFTELIVAKN